jgi:hypothetical protein
VGPYLVHTRTLLVSQLNSCDQPSFSHAAPFEYHPIYFQVSQLFSCRDTRLSRVEIPADLLLGLCGLSSELRGGNGIIHSVRHVHPSTTHSIDKHTKEIRKLKSAESPLSLTTLRPHRTKYTSVAVAQIFVYVRYCVPVITWDTSMGSLWSNRISFRLLTALL